MKEKARWIRSDKIVEETTHREEGRALLLPTRPDVRHGTGRDEIIERISARMSQGACIIFEIETLRSSIGKSENR